jgi:serine/threonine protein kinase
MESKPESYKKVKELGKGAMGKAYLVKGESSGKYAVIKQVDINSIKSRAEREKVYQVCPSNCLIITKK